MSCCKGKTALVTNASHATGGAAARALATAGARVLVHDDRSTAKLESVVQEIRSAGGIAKAIIVDISATQGPHLLARQTREIVGDRLDILVVNASLREAAGSDVATIETFDAQYAINIRAPFFLVQQLLLILSPGSSIIFTSPPAAEANNALPAYWSTADAFTQLVAHFAPLLKPCGIRVNAIRFDAVATTGSSFAKSNAALDGIPDPSAEKRLAVPEDIGATIAFLASDEARLITGQMVPARFMKRRYWRRGKPVARRTGVSSHG